MSDELENDTPTNEEEVQPNEQNESTEEKDKSSEELEKAKEVADNQKIRAEKAESENKKLKADLAKKEKKTETETPKNDEQSNEPDYAKLAFLEGKGLTNPDDRKLVLDEADRLKLPLTDILEMKHIKNDLKDAKDQREAEDGMPDDKGKPSGGTKNSVDYWKDRKKKDGTYETPDDLKLATEVIEARVKKEESGSKFSDDLYTG